MLSRQLIDHNILILKEADKLLCGLSNEEFVYEEPNHGISSIGNHIRHVIDHYLSFIQGMKIGIVNYDERERDAKYASHLLIARTRLHEICQSLEKYKSKKSMLAIKNDAELTISCGALAPRASTTSSIFRELGFLHGHAVHHFAFIRLLICRKKTVPGRHFGVALATQKYYAANS